MAARYDGKRSPQSPALSRTAGNEPDDNQMTRWMSCVLASALLLAATAGFAQEPAPVRVRGTIEAADGAMLTVRSRDRQIVYRIKVADDAVVRGIVPASLAEIKNDAFVVPGRSGASHAVRRLLDRPLSRTMTPRGVKVSACAALQGVRAASLCPGKVIPLLLGRASASQCEHVLARKSSSGRGHFQPRLSAPVLVDERELPLCRGDLDGAALAQIDHLQLIVVAAELLVRAGREALVLAVEILDDLGTFKQHLTRAAGAADEDDRGCQYRRRRRLHGCYRARSRNGPAAFCATRETVPGPSCPSPRFPRTISAPKG